MRTHKIERNMLEKIAVDFTEKQDSVAKKSLLAKQSARTQHFEKNYKKQ